MTNKKNVWVVSIDIYEGDKEPKINDMVLFCFKIIEKFTKVRFVETRQVEDAFYSKHYLSKEFTGFHANPELSILELKNFFGRNWN